MKKILRIYISILLLSTLIACKPSKTDENLEQDLNEPVIDSTFEEYLKNDVDGFKPTMSKIIDSFSEYYFKTNEVSNLKFDNSDVSISTNGTFEEMKLDGVNGVLWQEDRNCYFYYNEDLKQKVLKVNLDDVENHLVETSMIIQEVNVSKILSNVVLILLKTPEISLESNLDNIDFVADDFIVRIDDVYELKQESIARVVSKLSNGMVSKDEVYSEMKRSFERLIVNFKYINGKIRDIGLVMETNDNVLETKYSLSIKLTYEENEINSIMFGTNLFINYFETSQNDKLIVSSGTISNDETTLNFKLESTKQLKLDVIINNNKFYSNSEIIENDIIYNFKVDLNKNDGLINSGNINITTDAQNKVYDGSLKISLLDNKDIIIPEISMDNAEDLLELIINFFDISN